MDLLRRLQTISTVLLVGSLAVGCANPEFAPPDGDVTDPGAPGGPPGGVPGFMLPDAASSLPTPAAPGANPAVGQCAGEAYKAETSPLDLMLLIDSSKSMLELSGTRSKWELAQLALAGFLADPQSTGLGVGLSFFPHVAARACTAPSDCVTPFDGRDYCAFRYACAGGAAGPLRSCSPTGPLVGCAIGQTCVRSGVCSTSGVECVNLGQACPGAQGTCQTTAGVCSQVFPTTECEVGNYTAPVVSIGILPNAQPNLVQTLGYKVPGRLSDGVGTPMGPAVKGIIAHLQAHLAANPGRKAALVLTSDGFPSGCTNMGNDLAGLSASLTAANSGASPIPTYVIGVFQANELKAGEDFANRLAYASGTGKAFVLNATDDLAQQLQGALNQIRGAALPCEYKVPNVARIDYAKVNVRFTGTGGGENVLYVETPARCDPARGGWYYDYIPGKGPTSRVLMCDATCRRFKADQTGKVDIVYGCATQVIN